MFVLDSRIEKDSVHIIDLELCQVRLQNDQRYPWLVLLPKVADLTEVHELSEQQQNQLMKESSRLAQVLKTVTGSKKINVANLGNVVAQLHWHIVARFESDDTWPGPIWGIGKAKPYSQAQMMEFIETIKAELE